MIKEHGEGLDKNRVQEIARNGDDREENSESSQGNKGNEDELMIGKGGKWSDD